MLQLEIGTNEGKYLHDAIGVDIELTPDYWGEESMGGAVDIQCDAHFLPFRNEIFDEVLAGRVLIVYTGTDAVDEAIRVLKPKAAITTIIQFEYMTTYIDYIIRSTVLTGIEIINTNCEDDSPYDIKIVSTKQPWIAYDNPPYKRSIEHPKRKLWC